MYMLPSALICMHAVMCTQTDKNDYRTIAGLRIECIGMSGTLSLQLLEDESGLDKRSLHASCREVFISRRCCWQRLWVSYARQF